MEHEILPKWEAKFSTKLKKASADQIWPLFEDFFNLHRWFPGLSTCYGIHGTNGEPGCIRYCAGFSLPSQENNADGENPVSWSKERLVAVDPIQRSLSYEIVDSNIGFRSYSSKVRIVPGGDEGGDGCGIEWWITVDPVEGWKIEDLVKRYEVKLQLMAEKMEEDALRSSKKEKAKPKWEGKATAKLKGPAASQVWPLLEDFCSFNKWLPTIDTCYQVEGVNGQPGLIRYCAATISSSSDGTEKSIKWCHEKLLEIDPIQRCLSYKVLDNNLGFKSYVSKMKVLPTDGDEQHGCEIEWSFVADPVEGLTFEGLLTYFDSSLQGMAENMKKALLSN